MTDKELPFYLRLAVDDGNEKPQFIGPVTLHHVQLGEWHLETPLGLVTVIPHPGVTVSIVDTERKP